MNNQFGLAHFFNQADGMALALLFLLLMMSICTWTIAFKRVSEHLQTTKHHDLIDKNKRQGTLKPSDFDSPSIFTWAYSEYVSTLKQIGQTRAEGEISFLLDQCASRLDRGQIVLASIASTAPFVGLLGTVWGIYHALLAVAASGQASIDKIMGPVGETLLMTALGLIVALPAVVVYNLINRSNAKRLIQVQGLLQFVLSSKQDA